MYDMHYDLLTILYFNLIKGNKFANKEKLLNDLANIYGNNNVIGGIINLYFMTPDEMQEEIDISLDEMKDLKKMFLKSIEYLNEMKKMQIIPKKTDFIYSIEGCDYIKNSDELEELYILGLRSILPVWNQKNQYGSGNRTNEGLTNEGEKLIKKAIELGIIIDLSHANQQTFDDIINLYKNEKKENSIIMASHSNVRSLCDRERNLTDEQLLKLKNVGGYIGLFTNGNFLSKDNEQISYSQRQINFLNHLNYIINEIKFDINKIIISTDDMNYNPDESYHHLEAFPIENIKDKLFQLISLHYGEKVANKIMTENAQGIINKVNKKEKIYCGKHI